MFRRWPPCEFFAHNWSRWLAGLMEKETSMAMASPLENSPDALNKA